MKLSDHFKGLCESPDEELLEALIKAHYRAALENDNLSKQVAAMVTAGSGDFLKAVAAGILSLGTIHGPLLQARQLLRTATPALIKKILSQKNVRIPGWGNSFFKDKTDPAWNDVATLMRKKTIWKKIEMIDAAIKAEGKNIFPNAAIFTAGALEEMKWTDGTEGIIFLTARLPVWGLTFKKVSDSLPTIAEI
jgi:citrate synthase